MDAVELGIDIKTGEKVELGYEERNLGLYVIGAMGTGKSTLLLNLITQDMEAGFGVCVLDPPGSLVEGVLERVPAKREGDVVLLDPLDTRNPFGLNLFECQDPGDPELVARISSQVMHVFEKLWGPTSPTPSWGPQMADLIRNSALTLIENPGMTMAEMPLLLESAEFRARLVSEVTNLQVRSFWENTYDRLGAKDQIEYRLSTLNKVREFLTQPVVLRIVGQSKSTVNFRRAMDEGKIVLIPLSVGRLGEDVASLLGSVVIGQVLNAALSREELPEEQRRPFHLYADEYQRFATPDFATLLAEARKFKVATTIAHQFRDQFTLRDPNRGATLNVANKVVFRVSGRDADELAGEFDTTPPPAAVIGQKPVYAKCTNVLDHLILNPHDNDLVSRLVKGNIKPYYDYWKHPPADREWLLLNDHLGVTELTAGALYFKPESRFFLFSVESDLGAGLTALDEYWWKMMSGIIKPLSFEEEYLEVEKVVGGLSFGPMCPVLGLRKKFDALVDTYGHISGYSWCHAGSISDFEFASARVPALGSYFDGEEEYCLLDDRDSSFVHSSNQVPKMLKHKPKKWENLVHCLWIEAVDQLTENAPAEERSSIVGGRVLEQIWRFRRFTEAVVYIGRRLAEDPIMVATGQYEPIYDKPRTYQDMQNETATVLGNFPNRQARCKIVVEHRMVEHPFRTLPPRRVDASSVPSLERIRAGSRMLYTLPAAAVDEEIRKRQQYQVGSVKRVIPLT